MYLKNLGVIMAQKQIKGYQLSEDTGIARSTLSKHKNGKADRIEFKTLETLTNYLDCSLDELFGVVPYTVKYDRQEEMK